MKRISFSFLLSFVLLSCQQGETLKTNLPKPKEFDEKASYLIGYDIGRNMVRDSLKINMDYLMLGFRNAFKGDSTFVTNAELDTFRRQFQAVMVEQQDKRMKEQERKIMEQAPKNLAEGKAFLESNKNKPDVVTTPTGLQYTVLKEGNGKTPTMNDMVKIHIKAYYLDGKEFDNTYNRQPVTLPISQQVPGWQEALTHMKEGSKWRIYMPPNLGWGEKGAPPTIPPNATLIFEIELLSIENAPKN